MRLSRFQIDDVLPTSQNSWQVDWTETTRDRKGEKAVTAKWRGLVTIVIVPPSASTSETQLRRNPLGVYVQDVTWSRLD
jgi:type IV secretion system protein TrbF